MSAKAKGLISNFNHLGEQLVTLTLRANLISLQLQKPHNAIVEGTKTTFRDFYVKEITDKSREMAPLGASIFKETRVEFISEYSKYMYGAQLEDGASLEQKTTPFVAEALPEYISEALEAVHRSYLAISISPAIVAFGAGQRERRKSSGEEEEDEMMTDSSQVKSKKSRHSLPASLNLRESHRQRLARAHREKKARQNRFSLPGLGIDHYPDNIGPYRPPNFPEKEKAGSVYQPSDTSGNLSQDLKDNHNFYGPPPRAPFGVDVSHVSGPPPRPPPPRLSPSKTSSSSKKNPPRDPPPKRSSPLMRPPSSNSASGPSSFCIEKFQALSRLTKMTNSLQLHGDTLGDVPEDWRQLKTKCLNIIDSLSHELVSLGMRSQATAMLYGRGILNLKELENPTNAHLLAWKLDVDWIRGTIATFEEASFKIPSYPEKESEKIGGKRKKEKGKE